MMNSLGHKLFRHCAPSISSIIFHSLPHSITISLFSVLCSYFHILIDYVRNSKSHLLAQVHTALISYEISLNLPIDDLYMQLSQKAILIAWKIESDVRASHIKMNHPLMTHENDRKVNKWKMKMFRCLKRILPEPLRSISIGRYQCLGGYQ